ncbi:MAG: metallophosphoesterase [Chloroflexi bacterium]|nr:MAG: metallophosphoesterase [Chloroflexota bacterium]
MKVNRRKFLKLTTAGLAGGLLSTVGGYLYSTRLEANLLTIERVAIRLPHLPPALEGFRIVQLSDIHLHPFTQIEFVQAAVEQVNRMRPDLVALTGDYVLRRAESIFELAPVLGRLNARYGVVAILGNHDLWTSAAIVRQGLAGAGLPVLVNQGQTITVGRAVLYVAGVDDGWSGRPDLAAALSARPAEATTILLAHEPDLADDFAADGRVDLQLSGHSHGGQVRFPGIGAPILPYLGQKYDMGLYRLGQMWLYTNRGLGVIGPPVRFNCPPEVTEFTLTGV